MTDAANEEWRGQFVRDIFEALAASDALRKRLVFKGARVLALRLRGFDRRSEDIDASLAAADLSAIGGALDESNLAEFGERIRESIERYFDRQSPVVFELEGFTFSRRRKLGPHPRGWDVFECHLQVRDLRTRLSPHQLRIDVASSELYSSSSVSDLRVGSSVVRACTLERIAGEKLRAFLSSLPAYRRKIGETRNVPRRAKDLYDLVKIVRAFPLSDAPFWLVAGSEFQLACRSRCISCSGLETFHEDWRETETAFNSDQTLPPDVVFSQASSALEEILAFFQSAGVVPFDYPLTPPSDSD